MYREFKNYVIDGDLYYFLLAYNDGHNFVPTQGQKISLLSKDEVLKLCDEAIEFYKNRIKSIDDYINEL